MVDIVVIDGDDDALFDEWYAVMRASATHGRLDPSVFTRDALAFLYRHPTPKRARLAIAAVEPDRSGGSDAARIVGTASIELPLEVDTETAEVEVNVHPCERGRGVGASLWEWALAHCREAGRAVFQCEVNVPIGVAEHDWPGLQFARSRGFVTANVEDHLALDAAATFARLAARSDQAEPAGGLASYEMVSWIDRCPDDLVENYARMRTLMATDVPSGSMVRTVRPMTAGDVRTLERRLGESYRSLLSLALTGSGDPAGYTMMFVPIGDEANLLQDDTYVMREHRGHRLGERLKWVNLVQARAISPDAEWIHTYTEQGNAAMQRTNRDFGFVPIEVMHEVQLTL